MTFTKGVKYKWGSEKTWLRLWQLFMLVSVMSANAQFGNIQVTVVPESCGLGSAKIVVNDGQGNFYYNWNDGKHGQERDDLPSGTFLVSIIDALTGADTSIMVEIKKNRCKVGFSFVFSPNGDGINDEFHVTNTNLYPNFSLTIFNRWGQVVLEEKKIYHPWSGTYANGVKLPDDAYYYIFFYDDNKKDDYESGCVTIIR